MVHQRINTLTAARVRLECLQKLQDNIMLNNKLSQLSRG